MPYVQKLEDIGNAKLEEVGGKAANLAQTLANGFPVPPGFVINTTAYADHFARISPPQDAHNPSLSSGLKKADFNSDETGILAQAKLIRGKLTVSTLSGNLEKEILASHHSMQEKRETSIIYAVRSSATAEDLAGASFAGQHESYYYIKEDNLVRMIKSCWGMRAAIVDGRVTPD